MNGTTTVSLVGVGGQGILLAAAILAETAAAEGLDVDYLGVSPVFPTPTKTGFKSAWGLAGIAAARAASRHVLVGIGGISAANAAEALRAGLDGIAVVSAICASPAPEPAARAWRRAIARVRESAS